MNSRDIPTCLPESQGGWLSWGLDRLAQGLLGSERRPAEEFRAWTLGARRLSSGASFRLDDYPYLENLYRDPVAESILMKAGQVGATEYAVNRALWTTCEAGANVLFVLPVWTPDASDFSQARLKAAIEDSPDILARAAGIDNVGLKRVGRGLIYCRGSERRHSLKEMPIDLVIVEELDECNQANLPFAYRRLDHSLLKHRLMISNPTLPGYGIHALWEESDQRAWQVKCECGRWQALMFDRNLLPGPPAFWGCEKCGRLLDRTAGEWIAAHPERPMRGYHIPQALSHRITAQELLDDWHGSEGNSFKEQAFFNLRLGEPYAARGQQIELGRLLELRGEDPMPQVGRKCSMGVDVGTVLHVRISQRAEGGQKRAVWVGEVRDFADLRPLMSAYDVACAVVDALPETRAAQGFQAAFRGRVWLAYYEDNPKAPPAVWRKADSTVLLQRTAAADAVRDRVAAGGLLLPAKAEVLEPRDPRSGFSLWLLHLCVPVRLRRINARGQEVAVWNSAGRADHFFHAEVYDEAAFGHIEEGLAGTGRWSPKAMDGLTRKSPWKK